MSLLRATCFAASVGVLASLAFGVNEVRGAQEPAIRECVAPRPEWIWCDDFEDDRLDGYFEHNAGGGAFVRDSGVGVGESFGMRARFDEGQVRAGSLHLAFGRTPQPYFRPVDEGLRDYREIHWRFFVRLEREWQGGGGFKLTRATSFVAEDSWAQAMIAHVWSGTRHPHHLVLDPASGTTRNGEVRTTAYNDFARLRWLGGRRSHTAIFGGEHVGQWACIEVHVALNRPGRSDGIFELWIDGYSEVRIRNLDWVGSFDSYGINAIFLENYWDGGAPRTQERFFDNLVVSTERIGC